jgi:hypothetical protein
MRVLLEIKWHINWQEQGLNIRSQELNQLAASQLELPRKWSESGRTEITKIIGNPQLDSNRQNDLYKGLCQKNEGSVEIKQRPTKMCGRTTYRTLTPKRAPFQIEID